MVSGVQKQEALEEIERACQEKNARLFLTNTDKKKLLSGTDKGIRFSYKHYKKDN